MDRNEVERDDFVGEFTSAPTHPIFGGRKQHQRAPGSSSREQHLEIGGNRMDRNDVERDDFVGEFTSIFLDRENIPKT